MLALQASVNVSNSKMLLFMITKFDLQPCHINGCLLPLAAVLGSLNV